MRRSPLALAVLGLLENGPLHPYGIQRLIRQWGKDQVVNVGQRTSLYRMIVRLEEDGLISVSATEQDERYPERTVYHLTDEGRRVCREWLAEILTTPRNEFPEFPAGLSFVMLVPPKTAGELLGQRREALTKRISELQLELRMEVDGKPIPRYALLETEYQVAVLIAEAKWIDSVRHDLRTGKLTWTPGPV
ncbi:PadR family transcriptional regulator [Kribbella sp. NPDC026611]|uniref:PadR family transcriptional regulator n=1 Tax=Kribbella sp. NPDC026611 TaxID=3154911 RepID=UPI0033F6D507